MGLVVQFGGKAVRRARPLPTKPCEITIFPGVRYERHEAIAPPDGKRLAQSALAALPLDEQRH